MSDKVYTTLGFIGFCFLAVLVYLNWDGHNNTNYEVQSAYSPVERADLMNSQDLYNQMTGARSLKCPAESISQSKDGIINLGTVWGSYANHKYDVKCFFLSAGALDETTWKIPTSNWKTDLHLNQSALDTNGAVKFSDLFNTTAMFTNDGCAELVAPFNFQFVNLNSDIQDDGATVTQKIVIVNSAGNCRVTFNNVANWFCAGPIGTTSIKSTGDDGVVEWKDHYVAHHTVIGNSANASVKGGSTGDVIGYATADTTILVEVFESGRWSSTTVGKFLSPAS